MSKKAAKRHENSNLYQDQAAGSLERAGHRRLKVLADHPFPALIATLVSTWLTISWFVYCLEANHSGSNINSFGEALWWGIVTMMTVGYGDRYPVTTGGRIFAGFLMLAGVCAIGIITARISSFFLEQALLKGGRGVERDSLRDHFIVCGWQEDMEDLLKHVLDCNPDLDAAQLVLVANLSPAHIEELRASPRLKGLKVIVGDFFHAATLQRAAPEAARKVLVLADRSPSANGQVPNDTEADARTIMAAISLASLARGTLVAAEILDPKLDHHLKLAGIGEIIYSREYSRLLLGSAARGTGIPNVVHDLLDPRGSWQIGTLEVPTDLPAPSYAELKRALEERHPGTLVIGILEHTGNPQRMKELALREAQKTPNVETLLANLQAVKELRCNQPIFNPPAGYRVGAGAAAIVIEAKAANADVLVAA